MGLNTIFCSGDRLKKLEMSHELFIIFITEIRNKKSPKLLQYNNPTTCVILISFQFIYGKHRYKDGDKTAI